MGLLTYLLVIVFLRTALGLGLGLSLGDGGAGEGNSQKIGEAYEVGCEFHFG